MNLNRIVSKTIVVAALAHSFINAMAEEQQFDVIVYGGTAGGVAAAVQVSRMGKTVALIEPSNHIGGLTSGGLGATDIGNKAAIGGISREFYQRIKMYYATDAAWKWQKPNEYKSPRQNDPEGDDARWTFEPHVAEIVLREMLDEAKVNVFVNERMDRSSTGVGMNGQRIQWIRTESEMTFHGKQFIDATYEGDLLAAAGVSYVVGRESNDRYGETLNGVQTANATKHQLQPGIDPYVVKGDPTSGLLPGIDDGPGKEGGEDARVQAYCLRMCNTTHPENRRPFEKPADYNELEYELLFRNFEAGAKIPPWHPLPMPNRKTDTNNNRGFSTDYIGFSYTWPEADYATRDQIYRRHLRYQKGLMWTLANHPRVPTEIRAEFGRWGNCIDEFTDNDGWPHQLYVREGRRMVADCVMTEHHCVGREKVTDSVGLAAYTMDSHNVQRYVDEHGHVRNEGDVQVGGFPPYAISYRAIIPKESECHNLSVPIALSASHIAYGSIRMEPVFMVLGQSAATAACISIDNDATLQSIAVRNLQATLIRDNQVLAWTND
ncbi:MAG: FAD-dependent oxidoreductase [Planctomycetales bacterium]|nr:FAD-dependent oxidoreductase [Planctomycetales bacterium]